MECGVRHLKLITTFTNILVKTESNAYFYSTHDYGLNTSRETRDQQIVRNKQIENTVSAQLTQVLSCRLREGYTIKNVNYIPSMCSSIL